MTGQKMIAAMALLAIVVSSTAVSPVQKVLHLIEDMAGKVQKDLEVSAQAFTDSSKFCDEEVTAKSYAMKNSEANIEELSALSENESAKITQLETKIEDLSTTISGAEAELGAAVGLREKEHAQFESMEKELISTVEELQGAQAATSKSLFLTQLPAETRDAVSKVIAGFSSIVDASFMTHAKQAQVDAFLETNDESQGGAIADTLREMTDKAESTLSNTRKEESESAHAHAMLKQGMQNQISSLKEELADSTHGKQRAAQILAQAQKDLSVESRTNAADKAYSQDMKHECLMKAQEWEIDTRDGNSELGALTKAKGILTTKFASLVQTDVMHHSAIAFGSSGGDAKARALRVIEQLGRKVHSTALVSLAYRAAADPFVKIRGMIQDMIAKLMQEAAEEATQKAFCDEETSKSMKSKQDKEGRLGKTNARMDKAQATTADLTEQVAALSNEVAEIDAAVTKATTLRQKESSEFSDASQDFSESQEACASALEVLREYYEGASLVQTGSEDSTQGGQGIIDVLEFAESDFAKLLADATSTEEVAKSEFDKMMQDSKVSKMTKEIDIKGKQSELKSLKTALTDLSNDQAGTSQELDAVLDYLSKLKPQCETKVPTYEERKARRDSEIDGLKEALSILDSE